MKVLIPIVKNIVHRLPNSTNVPKQKGISRTIIRRRPLVAERKRLVAKYGEDHPRVKKIES